jgi:hypothetical protein
MEINGSVRQGKEDLSRGGNWTFWTLSKLVQIVQLVRKGRFEITHKNCGVSGLLSLAQLLLAYKLESELTRIPVVMTWVWR